MVNSTMNSRYNDHYIEMELNQLKDRLYRKFDDAKEPCKVLDNTKLKFQAKRQGNNHQAEARMGVEIRIYAVCIQKERETIF